MYQFTFQCSWKFRNSIASRYLSKLIWYYHEKIIKTILGIWHQINTCCRWAKQNYIKIRYKQWKRIFPIDFIAFIGINFSDLIIKNKLMFTQHLPSSFLHIVITRPDAILINHSLISIRWISLCLKYGLIL